MSRSEFVRSDSPGMQQRRPIRTGRGRARRKVARVGAALSVVMLVGVAWIDLAAAATHRPSPTRQSGPRAADTTATNVTFKQDVHVFSGNRPHWLPATAGCHKECDHRVQIEDIDRSGGFKRPIWVISSRPVDLGAVQDFQVTDSYETLPFPFSFSYFYIVSVRNGHGPVTLTLTELHERTYSSAFTVSDLRCRRWTSHTGSEPVRC